MKQVLQSLKTGATEVADVPSPGVSPGCVLIRSHRTLISAGTERMLVEFGQASLLDKARQQPDKVRMTIDKARTDGLMPTIEAIRNKLDQPLALGYCNMGVVLEVGDGVTGFAPGDRVASSGKHAEVVSMPVQLCARVPDGVSDDQAAFTVLGAIALQGIRLAQPTLGEAIVVTGLGLVGLMAVQLLRAQGCRVLASDFDGERLAIARRFGAETVDLAAGADPVAAARVFSRGRGVDAVLLTAATKSNEPVHQAAVMCRQRGRIVLIGVAGLDLVRDDFYKKELTFQVSSSYGPGRYDPNYEDKGLDYPIGFVRWTEQRNFEAVLDMMADGRVDVASLITHRFGIENAVDAYEVVTGGASSLGVMLEYGAAEPARVEQTVATETGASASPRAGERAELSFIGSGSYATAVLIPAFKATDAALRRVASSGGVSAVHAGRKFGFAEATTDVSALIADPRINAVVIATRHDSHASLVLQAMAAGKHVFVEKPLCLTLEELSAIESRYSELSMEGHPPLLMVGFNRRFAPLTTKMVRLLTAVPGPKSFIMTVNAGAIPADHWTQDPDLGGGRIIGEACHFVDLLRFLAASPVTGFQACRMDSPTSDTVSIALTFADGSTGTILYFANGHKSFPKERLEIFGSGRILQLDNFRRMRTFGWPGHRAQHLWRQDKGQRDCARAFVQAMQSGGPSPISFNEVVEVARISIELAAALR